jgi:hypothetical protein
LKGNISRKHKYGLKGNISRKHKYGLKGNISRKDKEINQSRNTKGSVESDIEIVPEGD